MHVSLNDAELYHGELPQGCGNQIFDYCHKIPLVQRPSVTSSPAASANAASTAGHSADCGKSLSHFA